VRVGGAARYLLDFSGPDADPCDDAVPAADPGEPYIVTAGVVQWYDNDNPALPPLAGLPPGFNNPADVVAPANYRVTFSPRGTVVMPAGAGTWALARQVHMFCIHRRVPNDFDAILITVTPVGRIKLYRWHLGSGQWVEM